MDEHDRSDSTFRILLGLVLHVGIANVDDPDGIARQVVDVVLVVVGAAVPKGVERGRFTNRAGPGGPPGGQD